MDSNNIKIKKRFKLRNLIIYLIFILLFTGATAPLLIFHGPFNNVKKVIVDSAMTTLSHKWIATTFLSAEEIQRIQSEDIIQILQQNNNNFIKFTNKSDKTIERYDITDGKRFTGYLLIIQDPTRVKVGYSNKLGIQGELTSQIAQDNGAVAAINAGGFSDSSSANSIWTGTGGLAEGIIMSRGKIIFSNINDHDQKVDITAITKKGELLVGPHSLNDLKSLNATDAVSFGPALVVDGQGTIKSGNGGWGIAPRTAIGQRRDGSIILLAIDGRTAKSIGASLRDVQNIMLQYGAYNASNLDGGSSTTMYANGKVINNPCDPLGERTVPSAFIVTP
ncbi:MAG: phosphodiester glycosidase family protein [Eubacteriales bacterium]